MVLIAAPVVYLTLRCANGSFWFQAKTLPTVKTTYKPVKGSLLFRSAVTSVDIDPTAPLGCLIVATTADGAKMTWFFDRAHVTTAGDHKTTAGLDGTLSVTIKP